MKMRNATNGNGASLGDDGGYFAIKGFLYQFDKTLIEILNNPQTSVAFENRQDIDYEEHVLQVKHKETQSYAHSKIRKPVENLLGDFHKTKTKKYCLYCHFNDKAPVDWRLSMNELDSIVSDEAKAQYSKSLRRRFLRNFIVRFSANYEEQFRQTLSLLKSTFSLVEDEAAILHHSILRSKLLNLSILPRDQRHISCADLKKLLEEAEVTVFQSAYSKYLEAEKYSKLIKKTYFTFRAPNLECFERLFLIEPDQATHQVELLRVAERVAKTFYKHGKSPQPYIAFRNLAVSELNKLKQSLFDQGTIFYDGTHFDGDRFRPEKLTESHLHNDKFKLKLVPADQLETILRQVSIKEVYQFFITEPINLAISAKHCKIQVQQTEQILQIIS